MAHRNKGPKRPVHRQATRKGGDTYHPRAHPGPERPEDQALIRDLRQAVRSRDPLGMAQFISAIVDQLSVVDQRSVNGQRSGPDQRTLPPSITVATIVDTFIDIRVAETTAALHVLGALLADEFTVHRIRRELAERKHPMPDHITGLGDLRVVDGRLMLDPFDDGVGVLLALTGPGVRQATFLIYIDAVLGGIVKDAFVVPESIEEVQHRLSEVSSRADLAPKFVDVSPANARALLDRAITAYAEDDRGVPPSDTWPSVRALLAMVLRTLPTGGSIPDEVDIDSDLRVGLDPDELDARMEEEIEVAHSFLVSPQAAHLTGHDQLDHDIAHVLSSFASMIGGHDPLHWSPPTVEIALDQILPVLLSGDPDEYARVPTVLRAFIQFAHAERGIAPRLTLETLAVVGTFEDAFLAKLDAPEVLAARAEMTAAFTEIAAQASRSWGEQELLDALGSPEAIAALDDEPLPDEPLDLTSVPDDIHDRVCRVAALVDRVTDALFDVEFRTACRRLLALVATNDPAIFRRRSKDETAAAAIVWIIGSANDAIGGHRHRVGVGQMMEFLGLAPGTPSGRAEPMLKAIGVNPHEMFGGVVVGTPILLVSQMRAALLRFRGMLDEF